MGIEIKNLNFSYGKKQVLKNINLNFEKGKIYGLLGLNGSGKTTLLKLVLNLLKEDQGMIFLEGRAKKDYREEEISKNIAYVPQSITITYDISVMDFLMMGFNPFLKLFEKPNREHEEIAEDYLRQVQIAHLREKNLNSLSGGELQMVLITRALIQNTDFIVMDEPVSNLDLKNQRYIMDKIREVSRKYSKTMIMSLHDPNLIRKYCDRAILLKQGEIIGEGIAVESINRKNLREIYDMPFEKIETTNGTNYVAL
jgi:iron complex transport system ATP-binding protein